MLVIFFSPEKRSQVAAVDRREWASARLSSCGKCRGHLTFDRDVEGVVLSLHRRERHLTVQKQETADLDRLHKL